MPENTAKAETPEMAAYNARRAKIANTPTARKVTDLRTVATKITDPEMAAWHRAGGTGAILAALVAGYAAGAIKL